MKTLIEKYEDLTRVVDNRYRELINQVKEVVFCPMDTIEFYDGLINCQVTTYTDNSGSLTDVRVMKISYTGGIYVAEDYNTTTRYWIGFNELSNLENKIQIVTLLEKEL